jgi:hypothetical protein
MEQEGERVSGWANWLNSPTALNAGLLQDGAQLMPPAV